MSTRMDILWALTAEPLAIGDLVSKINIVTGSGDPELLRSELKPLVLEELVRFENDTYMLTEKGQAARGPTR